MFLGDFMKTIQWQDKTIHFVPTAHVSKQSVLDVKETIELIQPEAVCIELDVSRADNLQKDNTTTDEEYDIKSMIKEKKFVGFAIKLLLTSFQKRIADKENTQVGGEMIQAIDSSKELDIPIHYIDRHINITMKRLWTNLSTWKKVELITGLILSSFEDEEIDIEELKDQDLLFHLINEMETELPHLADVILHERNQYMAEKIKQLPEKEIVVVIGAAHLQGIIEALDQEHSLQELNNIPEKTKKRYKQYIIPLLFILLFGSLFIKSPEKGFEEMLSWFLLSGGLASLGALLLKAHPLTLLATFIGAPIGLLSPVLSVGIFSGLAQAYIYPPRVYDFTELADDSRHVKGWYQNRFLNLLAIMLVTSLLSSIGTFITSGRIIKNLFQ